MIGDQALGGIVRDYSHSARRVALIAGLWLILLSSAVLARPILDNSDNSALGAQYNIKARVEAERVNDFETPGVMRLASERFD
jgi:hypothetical protein